MRIIVFSIVWLFAITNAWAEHEVNHRYNIRGYVLDENDRGIDNLDVVVTDGGRLLKRGKTDSAGYYSLHLHLHNTDNRRQLKLRAGSSIAEFRVKFDPSDLATVRVHDANFIAGEFVEGGLRRFRLPPWIYPLAGLFALGFGLVILEKRRKKKIRQKKIAATKKGMGSGSGKAGKRRKKR